MGDADLYHCVCFGCEEEVVAEDSDEAEEFFDQHAKRGHNVEIEQFTVGDGGET